MCLYLKSKQDLEELLLEKADSLIFRSKVRWFEGGEKSTRYFFNLEKSRYNAKTCQQLITETKGVISTDEEILREQHRFYSELYAKDDQVDFTLVNKKNIVISDATKKICEAKFSISEIRHAVKSMKNEKTPGEDGLPIEFYKIFWRGH